VGGDHHWFKRSTREERPVTRNNHDDDNNNNNIIIIITYSKYRLCIQFDETLETSYQHAQLAKEQYIRDMIQCMLNYTLTYAWKEG
jgi:hypothetical protein